MTIPHRILKIEGDKALVSAAGAQKEIRLLDDSFNEGDYVLVANKIAIEKLSEEEALEALDAWKKAIKIQEDELL
ncbi:MAG: HypC/HybG/HupF family hydrogenase formation chaperone [Nanoarchaeota archaeon]|nr:HypC/HybG/HupF family hydrogenase formation chaperone [Nanoarchaeota archaeon]